MANAKKESLVLGLRPTVVEVDKKRAGYAIYTKICNRCGTKVDHDNDKSLVGRTDQCPKCLFNRFTIIEKMAAQLTEGIINKTIRYKCVKCNKMYNQPQLCCNANHEIQGEEMQPGFYCTGCKRVYDENVFCCTDSDMYEGYYKPETYDEFLRRPKFLIPKNADMYDKYLAKNMKIGS